MRIANPDWEIIYESAEKEDGSLLFPSKLSREFLDKARRTMGSYIYANNYLNKIIPEDLQCFKREWFKYEDIVPGNCWTFVAIDPAISQEKGSDYTGISVVSVDADTKWHVRMAKRQRMTPSDIVNVCFELNDRFSPMCIGVETIAFQKALVYMIREEMKRRNKVIPIVEVKHSKDKSKEMRIRALIPRFEWGLIYLARGLHDLELELMQFPRGSHDDTLDSLSFIEQIAIYPEKRRAQDVRPNPNSAEYESWYINQKKRGKTPERIDNDSDDFSY